MADCAGANCRRRFVSCQGRTGFDASFPEMRFHSANKKGRLKRPFGFGRAECVSRRLSSIFVLRQNLPVFYLAVKT